MGLEADFSESSMDWEVRREKMVENSVKEMGVAGDKDGHQWWGGSR